MNSNVLKQTFIIMTLFGLTGFLSVYAGTVSGLKIGAGNDVIHLPAVNRIDPDSLIRPTADPLPGGTPQKLVNITRQGSEMTLNDGRAIWTEVYVEDEPTSGQGLVDVIMGEDGYLYAAYYDDLTSYPTHFAVFIKRSSDGGATWLNPDGGSNGFGLLLPTTYIADWVAPQPSIEVFEISPGNYRIAVACTAPWPNNTSPFDTVVVWKDIGSADWTTASVQNNPTDHYVLPRIKVVERPLSPGNKRIVCATFAYTDGRLWCDISDTNGESFGSYSAINPATDQTHAWRADFMEDTDNDRLYCSWGVETNSSGHPRVLLALSDTQGGSWYADLFAISPGAYDFCAEPDSAIASNPLQPNKTLMTVWTAAENPTDVFNIYYSYQFLDTIEVVPGISWDPSPAGFSYNIGTVYSDTDYDNTMPAIIEDNRISDGGYRVAFLDQYTASAGQVRYTETDFTTPVSWLTPEVVSAPGADPALEGSNALSMGVGYNNSAYPYRRCAVWPDFRDPEIYSNMYASYTDINQSPVPTATATPTSSPTAIPTNTPTGIPTTVPTDTPTTNPVTPVATSTPGPIPTTGPAGIGLLLIILGALLAGFVRRKR